MIVPQVKILSCSDIVCGCQAPQFEHCQSFCGFCVACLGSGLECCCCYGCARADCCAVCCAGVGLNFLSFLIYGMDELNHPPLFEYRHPSSFQKWPECLQVRVNLAQFGIFSVSDLVFHFSYRHLFQKYSENFIKFLVS
ncbi:Transmembrane_domain-containing protein [Hexamita inflata]|nr:Transmembrane domain-containing protein [Hexamita inflata]